LNELVVDRLRQAIIGGDYGLREPLSELRIATDLGTSKGPVRRAIVQLQMEGLVRVVPQSGTFVFSMGTDEIQKLSECRLILEAAALKLALSRDRDRLGKALQDAVSGMVRARKNDDLRSYLSFDTKFHEAIFAQCGNNYLADAFRLVSGKSAALRTHLSTKPQHTDLSYDEHREIAEAVVDGDLKTALKVLQIHIDRAPKTYSHSVGDIAAFDRRPHTGIDRKRQSTSTKPI
jgi:DNA-binding GntR family transcriptional regulator